MDELSELTSEDLTHLRRCVDLAREALEDGDEPFGSVLVDADGVVLHEDRNRTADGDQTRHPEFELARWAALHVAAEVRSACTVYAGSTAQLTEWRRGWGLPAGPVVPLPINAVAPDIQVAGPAPELADELRELHRRCAERGAAGTQGSKR